MEMDRGWGSIVFAGFLLVLGLAFAGWGWQYGLIKADGEVAPGLVPVVAGLMLAVFAGFSGAGDYLKRLQLSRDEEPSRAKEETSAAAKASAMADTPSGELRTFLHVMLVFVLVLIAILLAPVIGFWLSFGLLLLVLITLLEREKLWLGLLFGVGGPVFAWIIFVQILDIPAPAHFLDFIEFNLL
jgi:hypothetical protein